MVNNFWSVISASRTSRTGASSTGRSYETQTQQTGGTLVGTTSAYEHLDAKSLGSSGHASTGAEVEQSTVYTGGEGKEVEDLELRHLSYDPSRIKPLVEQPSANGEKRISE